ncbi:MBL fold metallo-hydrolase [Cupriavidus oxalaticus]|uniref:Zinc phosphodiesterase, putative tRNA 3' processing RNase Z homolog n=2 Tax=Cupriavidus oxalaticus TaxID=96344 RepID=A0A375FPU2_9BURK
MRLTPRRALSRTKTFARQMRLIIALALTVATIPVQAQPAPPVPIEQRTEASLVLLGTAGGRTSWRGTQSAGISSAVVVNGQVYLIDFGAGWLRRYFQAGLGASPPSRGLESLRAAFITHLHADHIIDYPSLVLFGASDGHLCVGRLCEECWLDV